MVSFLFQMIGIYILLCSLEILIAYVAFRIDMEELEDDER